MLQTVPICLSVALSLQKFVLTRLIDINRFLVVQYALLVDSILRGQKQRSSFELFQNTFIAL